MEIIFAIGIFLALFMPYIICILLSAITIWLISTRLISKTFKILIIIIILLCAVILLNNFIGQKPDDLYIKMNEINDNQRLIGLSKEVVVELLGKPKYEYNNREDKKRYMYYAGAILKKSFWGYSYSHDDYELNVLFDENDKVERTYIKCSEKN